MQRLLRFVTVAACLLAAPSLAHASFHLWRIQEVFSNQTGSIQYIELTTTFPNQEVVTGHTITFTVGTTTRTFTFGGNTAAGTANKTLLIATPGFASLPGVPTPDFTLPCGPLFDPAGSTITINFGPGQDILTITTPAVPTNGTQSLTDAMPDGTASLSVTTPTPRNFAGTTSGVSLTTCQNDGTCSLCSNGNFCDGPEMCAGSACADAPNPCPLMCNETTDTCFECDDAGDCNDGNACTDDTCNGSLVCVHTNNTLTCDDGLFCTLVDACSGGACVGTGDACPAQNCSEGGDFCGDCDGPEDCADGVFCNGDETCTTGACGPAVAEACTAPDTCDEDGDACVAPPAPDAGVPDAEAAPDAAGTAPDAGVPTDPEDDGCCSTGGAPASGSLLLLALVSLGLARRARR